MSRALPPLKGHLRKKVQPRPKTPPLPDNPYKRFFTENRSFEEMARKRKLKLPSLPPNRLRPHASRSATALGRS